MLLLHLKSGFQIKVRVKRIDLKKKMREEYMSSVEKILKI